MTCMVWRTRIPLALAGGALLLAIAAALGIGAVVLGLLLQVMGVGS